MGGSGGGGAGSGQISYATHMTSAHYSWLTGGGLSSLDIDTNITKLMYNAITSGNPYTALTAYDPTTEVTAILASSAGLAALVGAIDHITSWDAIIANAHTQIDAIIGTTVEIDADITAFANLVDTQITTTVLPRFEAGMRDINAVMSSAFVIGRAVIEEGRDHEVAKHGSALRLNAATSRDKYKMDAAIQMLDLLKTHLSAEQMLGQLVSETNRLSIVANKEFVDQDMGIEEADANWEMSVFQYGANVMASIGGGTALPDPKKGPSKLQSALGGAISGAGAGLMTGNPYAAAAGGVIGFASGLL